MRDTIRLILRNISLYYLTVAVISTFLLQKCKYRRKFEIKIFDKLDINNV